MKNSGQSPGAATGPVCVSNTERPILILQNRLGRARRVAWIAGLFAGLVQVLGLALPLLLGQIYDRVLITGSAATLTSLVILVIGVVLSIGLFEFLRVRILGRAAMWLDKELSPLIYRSWILRSPTGYRAGYRPIADLDTVRGLLTGPPGRAFVDACWLPVPLIAVFLLDTRLGFIVLAGVAIAVLLLLFNELMSGFFMTRSAQDDQAQARFADQSQSRAEVLAATGTTERALSVWTGLRDRALAYDQIAFERSHLFSFAATILTQLVQVAVITYAAVLALGGQVADGTIIAAALIAGRVLYPVAGLVAVWKDLKRGSLAVTRLRDYLRRDVEYPSGADTEDPDAHGQIRFFNVSKFAPRSAPNRDPREILSGFSFAIQPGDGLAVIGGSGAGKTALAKLFTGLWHPDRGTVRIDGVPFGHWDNETLGSQIGYMPQNPGLIAGTVEQNIARFDETADRAEVIAAAKMAGVHEVILGLSDGYETELDGTFGPLTGGQTQQIALATAVFRQPRLLVLDEPVASLDVDGENALTEALLTLRESGAAVVVLSNRPTAIAALDQVLLLDQGQMIAIGPKADIMRQLTRSA